MPEVEKPTDDEEVVEDEEEKDPAKSEEDEEEETDEEKQEREKKEKEAADKAAAEDEAAEPPVRRSAESYIIERKNKKIEKLSKKDEDEEEIDEEEDENLTPSGKKAISRAIEEQVGPIKTALKRETDEKELQGVLSKYGENAKPLETKLRKYMDHPAYAGVPVEQIFLGLAAKKYGLALPDKEKEKEEADEAAGGSKIPGGSKRKKESTGKIPDVSKMSDAEVDRLADQVKTGQF